MTARAVLVGVTSTTGIEYEPLECAELNVRSLMLALELNSNGKLNFDAVTTNITNTQTGWRAEDLLDVVDREIEGCDHFLFYFAGHGDVTEYGLQLVMPDKTHRLDLGVYFNILMYRFNKARKTEVTVILDCCRSGLAGDSNIHEALKFTELRDGVTVLASSGHEEDSFASTQGGMSDFTHQVVECLNQATTPTDVLDVYKWTRLNLVSQNPVLRTFGSRHSPLRT